MQYCTAEVPEGSLCRGYNSTRPQSPSRRKLRNGPKAAQLEVEDAVTKKVAVWTKAKSKKRRAASCRLQGCWSQEVSIVVEQVLGAWRPAGELASCPRSGGRRT